MLFAVNARPAGLTLLILGFCFDEVKFKVFDCRFSRFNEGVFADMAEALMPVREG